MTFSKSRIKTLSRLGSCGAYGLALMEMPDQDDRMVALTADLCHYSGLDHFYQKYPDYFYNVGIAEQNLIGIAGGLASEGFHPYVSTYASFACTRALDQVKVNMGYMKMPVRLFGLTSGLSTGILGATHMCLSDIAIMTSIPGLTVISPADGLEIVKTINALINFNKPVYVRLTGSLNAPILYNADYEFQIGKAIKLRSGDDITIYATGSILTTGLMVADMLEKDGIHCTVFNMHTLKPIDTSAIECARCSKLIVTIEEHSIIGGLGDIVANYVATHSGFPLLKKIGIRDYYAHATSYGYLLNEYGLTADKIYENIKTAWEKINRCN